MKVGEAVKRLLDMPQDADLVICGHEFPHMENKGWLVQDFDRHGEVVLVEGAAPSDERTDDA